MNPTLVIISCVVFILLISILVLKAAEKPIAAEKTIWAANRKILANSLPHAKRPGFLEPDEILFPNYGRIREAYPVIREEALKLIDAEKISSLKDDMLFGPNIKRGDWKKFYIKWYNDIDPEARKLMPRTAALIESMPEVHLAMISIMEPRTRIGKHIGVFAGCLRYHLGLQTPRNGECFIRVAGEKYTWRDGEDVIFNDLEIHEVENKSDERRVILFLDVERPMKNKYWTDYLRHQIAQLGPKTTRWNERNETQKKQEKKK